MLVLTIHYLDYRTVLSPCTFSIIFHSFSHSQGAYSILASVENLFTSPPAWNLFMTPIANGMKSKPCSSASTLPAPCPQDLPYYFPGGTRFSATMAFVGAVPDDGKEFLSFPCGCPTLVFQNQPCYLFFQAFLSIFSGLTGHLYSVHTYISGMSFLLYFKYLLCVLTHFPLVFLRT